MVLGRFDLVPAVAVGTDDHRGGDLSLEKPANDLPGGNVMVLVAFAAHGVDLTPPKSFVGFGGADVLVIGVTHAGAVATGARDPLLEMRYGQGLFDERHMADVAPGVRAEGIVLLSPGAQAGEGGSN